MLREQASTADAATAIVRPNPAASSCALIPKSYADTPKHQVIRGFWAKSRRLPGSVKTFLVELWFVGGNPRILGEPPPLRDAGVIERMAITHIGAMSKPVDRRARTIGLRGKLAEFCGSREK